MAIESRLLKQPPARETSAIRRVSAIFVLVAVAVAISAVLYARSQSADFGHHARAVEALGSVRHLNVRLSQQVLAARFGLLNQYDPITATEIELSSGADGLRATLAGVVKIDGTLDDSLRQLDRAIAIERAVVEHFKAENSVLKNSVYYLPTAARELERASMHAAVTATDADAESAARQLVQTALVYNLIGDQTAREAHLRALGRLHDLEPAAPQAIRSELSALFAHANVVANKQPSVDRAVKEVVESDVSERLKAVEGEYLARFGETITTANRFRNILYGWSLVLALAVGAAAMQLRRLYGDLEHRVAERTEQLQKALAALWGEMKLARKIQEALVPISPRLSNCEVAASMKATDEVGGDYYDIIRIHDREWILIGDVSGHGVPAGLIMMMCHTAVRAVLRSSPDIMPDRLLAFVNTVLTENIRQLGEDKYMTISALCRDPDGTISFAGAHQDLCVYRAATDSVEAFESEGLWLGLKDRIDDTLTMQRFQLGAGDVLFLFTDGITEATKNGALFDMVGIRRVLDRARGKSAEQVLDDLFKELDGYELSDDATALVLRQLAIPARSTTTASEPPRRVDQTTLRSPVSAPESDRDVGSQPGSEK
jgi:serine phosphatase RsbU (regulator of sigma subunit)